MNTLSKDNETNIKQRLDALKQEQNGIQKQYDTGSLSQAEYKQSLSKVKFQEAQLVEQNQQEQEREQGRVHERERSWTRD